jgi:hypothetical protein
MAPPLIGYSRAGSGPAVALRLSIRPINANPRIIIAQVAGSGTGVTGTDGTSGVAAVVGGEKIPPTPPPGSGMLDRTGGPPGVPGVAAVVSGRATGGPPATVL